MIFAHSDQPTRDPQGRVHTMCHAVPGKWCVFGCMLVAPAAAFQWFRNNLGRAEVAPPKRRRSTPTNCSSPRPNGPARLRRTILPPVPHRRALPASRSRTPAADGSASPRRTTRAMLIRSLLEGVTFGMRDALEIMQADERPDHAKSAPAAAGARSEFWRQLQADIYNQPIVLTNAAEGPAYGVALLAGVGIGVWKQRRASLQSLRSGRRKRSNRISKQCGGMRRLTRRMPSCMTI